MVFGAAVAGIFVGGLEEGLYVASGQGFAGHVNGWQDCVETTLTGYDEPDVLDDVAAAEQAILDAPGAALDSLL